MSDDTQAQRPAAAKLIKRGLAWVFAIACGCAGLGVGYAIGERQARIACLQTLAMRCPKLPTETTPVQKGRGSDLRFYDELAPKGTKAVAQPQEPNRAVGGTKPATQASKPAVSGTKDVEKRAGKVAEGGAERAEKNLGAVQKTIASRPTQEPVAKKAAAFTAPKFTFALQLGSFPSAGEAAHLVAVLRAHRHKPRVVREIGLGNKPWFKVLVGRFDSQEAAQRYKAGLAAAGATALVVKEALEEASS